MSLGASPALPPACCDPGPASCLPWASALQLAKKRLGSQFCASLLRVGDTYSWGPVESSLAVSFQGKGDRSHLPHPPQRNRSAGWVWACSQGEAGDNEPGHWTLGQVYATSAPRLQTRLWPQTLSWAALPLPPGPGPPSLGDRAGEGTRCFLSPKGSQVATGSLRRVPPRGVRTHAAGKVEEAPCDCVCARGQLHRACGCGHPHGHLHGSNPGGLSVCSPGGRG